MQAENIWSHYGLWGGVIFWILLYSVFMLFTPFYEKVQRKPNGVYLAFIIAFAIEMQGIPFSMYRVGWLYGFTLPEGVF